MSYPLLFILIVLAAYRIWRLFAVDAFPPTMWIRDQFERTIDQHFGSMWAGGIHCPWCSGFWITCGVVVAVWATHPLPLPGLWFAAASTTVGLLAQRDEA